MFSFVYYAACLNNDRFAKHSNSDNDDSGDSLSFLTYSQDDIDELMLILWIKGLVSD